MSFEGAFLESRSRFTEVFQLISDLSGDEDGGLRPVTTPQKAMRGLSLVAIYGAVERSINAFVEQAIGELSKQQEKVIDCIPQIQSLVFQPGINSIRDCSYDNLLDTSCNLFSKINSGYLVKVDVNPFQGRLQNVDGNTMYFVASLLGVSGYGLSASARGRLNNLRERRNAVAHGRESPATAGERFRKSNLREMYEVASTESGRFGEALKLHFVERKYISQNRGVV